MTPSEGAPAATVFRCPRCGSPRLPLQVLAVKTGLAAARAAQASDELRRGHGLTVAPTVLPALVHLEEGLQRLASALRCHAGRCRRGRRP